MTRAADRADDGVVGHELLEWLAGIYGGFNRSSQHPFRGGCDEEAEASIRSCRTSSFAFTGAPSGGRTRRTKGFLGSHCRWVIERGGCGCCRHSVGSRRAMVPEGGRHGASNVQALGQAAVWPVSLLGRARRYCAHAGPGLLATGDRASARAICIDNLARTARQSAWIVRIFRVRSTSAVARAEAGLPRRA